MCSILKVGDCSVWRLEEGSGSGGHEITTQRACDVRGFSLIYNDSSCLSWRESRRKLEYEVLPGYKDVVSRGGEIVGSPFWIWSLLLFSVTVWKAGCLHLSTDAFWLVPHVGKRVQTCRRKDHRQRQRKSIYQKANYLANRRHILTPSPSWSQGRIITGFSTKQTKHLRKRYLEWKKGDRNWADQPW